MKRALLEYLACPHCRGGLKAELGDLEGLEAMSGTIECVGCQASFPVVRGVPRMNASMEGLENVARTFGYEWKAHHQGKFERETLFGRTEAEDWRFLRDCVGIASDDVSQATVLDAGCGSGRFTRLIAEHGALAVVGVDINEAVDEAFEDCRHLDNAHIVQGNVLALPLKRDAFDVVWSHGVIHHTPNAARAHSSLAQHVRPGGTLYVWVYAKRFSPFKGVKTALDAIRPTRLPEPVLFRIAKVAAYPSIALLQVYRAIRRLPGLRPRTRWGDLTVRPRRLEEVQLTWFDALSPEYETRHTEDEVVGWFERVGFEGIVAIEEPKVGVRGVRPSERTRTGAEGPGVARDNGA